MMTCNLRLQNAAIPNASKRNLRQVVASKPKLIQISTANGKPGERSPVIPRNKYVESRRDKPQRKEQRDWPEYKTRKYTAEARKALKWAN
jgi:hypothetical protein